MWQMCMFMTSFIWQVQLNTHSQLSFNPQTPPSSKVTSDEQLQSRCSDSISGWRSQHCKSVIFLKTGGWGGSSLCEANVRWLEYYEARDKSAVPTARPGFLKKMWLESDRLYVRKCCEGETHPSHHETIEIAAFARPAPPRQSIAVVQRKDLYKTQRGALGRSTQEMNHDPMIARYLWTLVMTMISNNIGYRDEVSRLKRGIICNTMT